MDICIDCGEAVGARQEAVQCDGCFRWQHRRCDTGISRDDYRRAVQGMSFIFHEHSIFSGFILSSKLRSKQGQIKKKNFF